jgi:hypothetical protein
VVVPRQCGTSDGFVKQPQVAFLVLGNGDNPSS